MIKVISKIKKMNVWLKLILFFVFIGFCKNFYLFFAEGGETVQGYRLFGGFALLFGAQIVFIILKDWRAALFSGAQCFFCVFLYEDFTFLPLLKPVFQTVMALNGNISLAAVLNMQYVMVSLLLSLEMLKTYLIVVFFKIRHEQKS